MLERISQTEIENYLICAVIEDGGDRDIFDLCLSLGVSSETFTGAKNQVVWEAFVAISAEGQLIEEGNLVVELAKDQSNGPDAHFVATFAGFQTSPLQWRLIAKELVQRHTQRELKRQLRLGIEAVDENQEPSEIISNLQKSFESVELCGSDDMGMSAITDMVYGNLLDDNAPDKVYYPTGLTEHDKTLKGGGYGAGQLVVWAARPGLGKTTIALNAADHNVKLGIDVGIISLEMDEEELGEKLAVMDCGIPSAIFEDKVASVAQKGKMAKSLKKISTLPFHICCRSRSLPQIIQKCRTWVKKKGVKVVIIDYCQLIRGDKNLPREQQIAEISRELKLLAGDLKIAIILIAQLNRDSEKSDRRPIMSDLRESGALEQDANSITFLYLLGEDKINGEPDYVRWYRAKQRAGQTAEGKFGFKRALGRFSSYYGDI